MNWMNELIGKRIVGVRISGERDTLVFDTDAGPIAYDAIGDCCSRSWYEHIAGLDTLIGHTVAGVASESGGCREDSEFECLRWDFIAINTDKGTTTIDFRNSSNGYYSGWPELVAVPDGVRLRPLTEDF